MPNRFELLAFMLTFTMLVCDKPYASAQENVPSWESTVVKKTYFDFGDVKPATDINKIVLFKNDSSAPYEIKSVSSSCGCMKPEMLPGSIAPGESKELKIKLDTVRFLGRRSASIHVLFAKPAGREIKLSAKVNIRNLVCEPEEIQFLGSTRGSEAITRELTIKRIGSPFWQIKSIQSSSESITPSIESSEVNGNQVRYKIVCSLTPSADSSGIQHEKLTLQTNDSSLLTYDIPIVIRNSGRVATSPKLMDFSSVAVGKKKLLIVRFETAVEPKFEVAVDSGFEIAGAKKRNDRTWKLEVVKSSKEATDTRLKIMTSDWKDAEEVKIMAREIVPEIDLQDGQVHL